ncbi:sugar kinase [Kineococcus glutinatus]|uniref:Sugar kinase n=1 Tax=Kineococcus glutinatus TaxID=1070872 RepID=A0ABP9HI14_9ACTN
MSTPADRPARLLTFGETMGLASARSLGSLVSVRDYTVGFGGSESNVAIGVRRLGVAATWVSRLGDDAVGSLIARELRAEDVRCLARTVPGAPTGFMLKERRSPEHTVVTYYRRGSAASALEGGDVDDALLAEAGVLHATGITPALSATARAATLDVCARARARGVPVSFDLNYRSRLWGPAEAAAFYREVLPSVDLLFAGVEEAQLLVPGEEDPERLARALSGLGPAEVVVKRGGDGAAALVGGRFLAVPAVAVEVVDTVGAGDAFVAGYLADLLTGAGPEARLATAALTGALACTTPGDWEAAPTRADLARAGSREAVLR